MASIEGLAALLSGIHSSLAFLTKAPEFELSPPEAKMLAQSAANVAQHYDVVAMSEKGMAWYGLAQTAALVYGPRIFAARNRVAQNKRAARESRAREEATVPTGAPATPRDDGMPSPPVVDMGSYFGGSAVE